MARYGKAAETGKLHENNIGTRRMDRTLSRDRRIPTWVNWALALLTAPGAALVFLFAMGGVMGTAGCTDPQCPPQWLSDDLFGVLMYGPAVVTALTIAVSFYTATRRRGILVPLGAWALLATDVAILAVAFAR